MGDQGAIEAYICAIVAESDFYGDEMDGYQPGVS